MTEHDKYVELKKGFNKVQSKKIKWKSRYYNERRRRKLATKFIGILQEGITEQVSHSTLQKILDDYYVADRNITNLIKIQNENRREIKWQRKKK